MEILSRVGVFGHFDLSMRNQCFPILATIRICLFALLHQPAKVIKDENDVNLAGITGIPFGEALCSKTPNCVFFTQSNPKFSYVPLSQPLCSDVSFQRLEKVVGVVKKATLCL